MGDSLDIHKFNESNVDPDAVARQWCFTKTLHRDIYPAVDPKKPENSAAGKAVLITGGSHGIGKAIALGWAIAGASAIIITARGLDRLKEAEKDIKEACSASETKVLALQCDATDLRAVSATFAKIKTEIGHVDVLISNVGYVSHYEEFLFVGAKKPEDFLSDIDINLKATYLAVHFYLTTFTSNDPGTATGTIISISSGAALVQVPGMAPYCLSKVAMHRLLDSVQGEYPNMRVFSLSPGTVREGTVPTPFLPYANDKARLSGGVSLWLSGRQADFLKGTWLCVNWDVEELVQHKEEIERKGLLKSKFMEASFGPEGYSFES